MEQAIEDIWSAYDADKDGLLEKSEADNFYTNFVLKDERFKHYPLLAFEDWYDSVHKDNDGKISKQTMVAFLDKIHDSSLVPKEGGQ